MEAKQQIESGACILGIELGSTRIKAVLINPSGEVLAVGNHPWENRLLRGIWTYALDEVHSGLRGAYQDLKTNVRIQHGCRLRKLRALGISAMMHGYLAFDRQGQGLAEFRTWRNTTTSEAAEQLSQTFQFNIPQRWSVAHLYQAILNGESHVAQIAHINTLAGYIHWQLTGRKILGIGDASGMFPIDTERKNWDSTMLQQFDGLHTQPWKLRDLLPQVQVAGQEAGILTVVGAALLDPSGDLESGALCCPPEGDAGTGMVATNTVSARTGNISAGTSIFAMLVLEAPLSQMRRVIDLVTTPEGLLVAMAHCNNGSSDLDAWMKLFGEAAQKLGARFDTAQLFETLYRAALEEPHPETEPDLEAEADAACGGLLHYGYVAGEDLVGLPEGRPLFVRRPDSPLTLAHFMRSQLYSSLCALKVGINILMGEEGVRLDEIRGHGGFFKTQGVGQRIMAAVTETPVTVLPHAGEGGAWGIALLAAYAVHRQDNARPDLAEFLAPFFASAPSSPEAMHPDPQDVADFRQYFQRFRQGLEIERAACRLK
ncbi:MAG: FGGY-family carbohydrate kinase [Spirochaetota bacterium]